jgi:hypothetical protein
MPTERIDPHRGLLAGLLALAAVASVAVAMAANQPSGSVAAGTQALPAQAGAEPVDGFRGDARSADDDGRIAAFRGDDDGRSGRGGFDR